MRGLWFEVAWCNEPMSQAETLASLYDTLNQDTLSSDVTYEFSGLRLNKGGYEFRRVEVCSFHEVHGPQRAQMRIRQYAQHCPALMLSYSTEKNEYNQPIYKPKVYVVYAVGGRRSIDRPSGEDTPRSPHEGYAFAVIGVMGHRTLWVLAREQDYFIRRSAKFARLKYRLRTRCQLDCVYGLRLHKLVEGQHEFGLETPRSMLVCASY